MAAYIANDGGNAISGECKEFILAPIGSPPTYGSDGAPTSGPFQELNNDQCGDLDSANVVFQRIETITITCRDQVRLCALSVLRALRFHLTRSQTG